MLYLNREYKVEKNLYNSSNILAQSSNSESRKVPVSLLNSQLRELGFISYFNGKGVGFILDKDNNIYVAAMESENFLFFETIESKFDI